MAVEPDLVVSCVEVAVQVAVPTADGVRTPAEVMVALVAVQVTAELYAPVPITCAVQVAVWTKVMDGDGPGPLTITKEIVGVLFPLPPLEVPLPQPKASDTEAAARMWKIRRPKTRRALRARGRAMSEHEAPGKCCMNFPYLLRLRLSPDGDALGLSLEQTYETNPWPRERVYLKI